MRVRGSIVIVEFTKVANEFGYVVGELDNKFKIYSKSKENKNKVFGVITQLNVSRGEGGEMQVCAPPKSRNRHYNFIEIPNSGLLVYAKKLYSRLVRR